MNLKDLLQGKWMKHPIHPALVSIPVGLWSMALVFDLLSRFGGGNATFVRTSFYCILVGLLGAFLAVPTGVADFAGVKPEKPAWRLGFLHLTLNVTIAILFAINLGLRWGQTGDERQVAPAQLALSVIGVVLLWPSVYLGGRMTYEHGVSVARHSKDKWRRRADQGGANVPAKEGDS